MSIGKGQTVDVRAYGLWTCNVGNTACITDASGVGSDGGIATVSNDVMTSAARGSLIAGILKSDGAIDTYAVGKNGSFVAANPGELEFIYNDNFYSDNGGTITASLRVYTP